MCQLDGFSSNSQINVKKNLVAEVFNPHRLFDDSRQQFTYLEGFSQ